MLPSWVSSTSSVPSASWIASSRGTGVPKLVSCMNTMRSPSGDHAACNSKRPEACGGGVGPRYVRLVPSGSAVHR